jgi:hypothetical protein
MLQFDFLNYISDKYTSGSIDPVFPSDNLGELMTNYTRKLINNYQISYDEVIEKIENREYDKLFLKARFRNLSTLEKKLKDASRFEDIITTALRVGYNPADIIIIDTDLSLSESFLSTIELSLLLRKLGYTNALLMELAYNEDSEEMRNKWLTIADDEGDFMSNLIKDIFYFLEYPF